VKLQLSPAPVLQAHSYTSHTRGLSFETFKLESCLTQA